MNIREGMGIKTIEGAKGTVTKVEMQSHHGEVWYDLRIILASALNGTVLKKICISILSLLVAKIYRRLV